LYENNLSIVAARYGVDGSRAARLAAAYMPNPTLTTSAEQLKTDRRLRNYAGDTGTASNPTYTFRIDQLNETGGKRRLRTESAEMQLMASEAQVLDALRQQTLQMKQFFYSALLAHENMKSAKEILESVAKTEELMSNQARKGNIAEADVIKFQANKIQFERDAATEQLSYVQALRDLINILGAKSPTAVGGGETAPALELIGELTLQGTDFDQEDLRNRAVERPDVIAARRNLEAAEKNVDLSCAQRKVDVTIGGEYQRVGGDNTAGLVISVPLPVYNNHKANISQAEAQRNAAFAQYRQAKSQAVTDVDKAWQSFTANKKIAQLYATETLNKARESLEIVQKAYDHKSASLLDLLDAQRTYKQTLLAAHQAQYDLLVSVAQLESASGQKRTESNR
jgi:cobalt-zinc-cadmium efflux system outer membrane protein